MKTELMALSAFTLLAAVDTPSALGSSVGCLFFLSTQSNCTMKKSALLGIISFGFGYSFGVAVPDSQAMWVSLIGAALGSVILVGAHKAIKGGHDLPPWLKSTIEYVLRVKK